MGDEEAAHPHVASLPPLTTTSRHPLTTSVHVWQPRALRSAALAGFRAASQAIDKYVFLRRLQQDDVNAFHRLLVANSMEIMPYVYTPTVGEACQAGPHRLSRTLPQLGTLICHLSLKPLELPHLIPRRCSR